MKKSKPENYPRILIIDDKPYNRLLFKECLSEMDLCIDEASTSVEGLSLLQQNQYMLVFLDAQIHGMNGFELLRKRKDDLLCRDTPVMLFSDFEFSVKVVLEGLELGATEFIKKPVNIDYLKLKVNAVLHLYRNQLKLDGMVRKLEKTNQRLKENEQRFKRITQSASDAIIQLDPEYRIRFWNRAAERIFGFAKYEVASENFVEKLILEKSGEDLLEEFKKLDAKHSTSLESIRVKGVHMKGFELPLEISLALFQTAEGAINYTVVARDISQRIKMEEEALRADKLRDSNKVMKQFMDNVSHELRTPTNAITGISKMLLKYHSENLLPKQLEGLKIIKESGERLVDMVNDVLDLSRIESKKEKLKNEIFNLDHLLASLNSIALSLIGEKSLAFSIRKSGYVPEYIHSDPKKIQQILLNLIANSVKFTTVGKIQLNVHLIKDALHFEVSDTGIGIKENNIERIFDRFYQADNDTGKTIKGSGLGLNIVKELVSLMKGEVKAESRLGKGTIMSFHIKVGIPDFSDQVQETEKPEKKEVWAEKYQSDKKLVLLIDYREEQHFLVAGLLMETGHQVVSCYETRNAYQTIRLLKPDLIILNMEMPKIHGYSLLNQIRKDKQISSLPILAFTSIFEMSTTPEGLNIHLIHETLREDSMYRSLTDFSIKPTEREKVDMIVLLEKESVSQRKYFPPEISYPIDSAEKALIMLQRRKVQTLVLAGVDPKGENMLLCRELSKTKEKLFQNLYLVGSHAFATIGNELNELLPEYQYLSSAQLETNKELIRGLATW